MQLTENCFAFYDFNSKLKSSAGKKMVSYTDGEGKIIFMRFGR